MKNTLVVISKNKTITADTVAPIIREFKEKTGGKVYFYVPHRHAIDFLKENFILYDAICEVSDIRVISYGGKFKRKFIYISTLLYWLFLLVNGAKFIHFGMLDIWPFNFLSFIKSNNIYYMQNDTFSTSIEKVEALVFGMGDTKALLYEDFSTSRRIYCKNIIVSDSNNYILKNPKNKGKNIFILRGTRIRKSWLEFIDNKYSLFNNYHNGVDFSRGVIVYALTTFASLETLRNKNTTKQLFLETMHILDNMKLDIPVIIKPHPVTQMDEVNNILDKMESNNFYISYLHPTFLSLKAKIWLCNVYSTTCADAYCMGVTTIEYTDYSDTCLQALSGKSFGDQYIDHFIQNDSDLLNSTIIKSMNKDDKIKNLRCTPIDSNDIVGALSSI